MAMMEMREWQWNRKQGKRGNFPLQFLEWETTNVKCLPPFF